MFNRNINIMKKGFGLILIMCLLGMATMFQGCKKATVPELTTADVTQITLNSAVSGGTITSDGGEDITEKGVCWSTSTGPTIADSRTSDGDGSTAFTSNLVGLAEGTPYYVRAYATNSVGTAYGNEVTFSTSEVTGAVLTTTEASSITPSSAVAGGNVTDAGGGTVTARGVCWGTAQNPTTDDNKATSGTGTGSFTINLSGLDNGTVYYYRAFATNSFGTSYGEQYHFITPVADTDGNVYQTVAIGTQVWMAENLKTTKYNDDSAIPNVTDNTEWMGLTTAAYCWANNDEATYKDMYGALYNWYAVETGNLCPTGWHVPTDADFIALEVSLGMSEVDASGTEWRGTDQGEQLKNTTGWPEEQNGTNTSGFMALPAGYRSYQTGVSEGLGVITYWWTSTALDDNIAAYRRLDADNDAIYRNGTYKQAGKSIRCVKD